MAAVVLLSLPAYAQLTDQTPVLSTVAALPGGSPRLGEYVSVRAGSLYAGAPNAGQGVVGTPTNQRGAIVSRRLSSTGWAPAYTSLPQSCFPGGGTERCFFGEGITLGADRLYIYSRGISLAGAQTGLVHEVALQPQPPAVQGVLRGPVNPLGFPSGWFAMSASDTTLAVGAPNHGLPGGQRGRVFIYEMDSLAGPRLVQQIVAPASGDPNGASSFGRSLSLDGRLLVVGEPDSSSHGGRVHVYECAGGHWSLQQTLESPLGPAQASRFGGAVAIDSGSGALAACHVPTGLLPVSSGQGRAWIYEPTAGGQYSLRATFGPVESSTLTYPAWIGASVAIDDKRLVIGGPYEPVNGVHCGAVQVIEREPSGWTRTARLVPRADPLPGDQESRFGASVAIDGGWVAVGQPDWTSASQYRAGRAHIYAIDQGARICTPLQLGTPELRLVPSTETNTISVVVQGAPSRLGALLVSSPGAPITGNPPWLCIGRPSRVFPLTTGSTGLAVLSGIDAQSARGLSFQYVQFGGAQPNPGPRAPSDAVTFH